MSWAIARLPRTSVLLGALAQYACGDGGDTGIMPVPDFVYDQPTRVDTTLAFATVGLGFNHSCMITAAGVAYCWGDDQYGQLGTTAAMQRCLSATIACTPTPLPVAASFAVAFIDGAVRHSCALDASGAAYCWGYGAGGQLGDGLDTDSATPVAAAGGLRFTTLDVGIGGLVTCGLTQDGSAYCWGPGNAGGLGNGSTDGADVPTAVATPSR